MAKEKTEVNLQPPYDRELYIGEPIPAKEKTDGLKRYSVTGFQTDPKGHESGDVLSFVMKAADLATAYKEAKSQVKAIIGGQSCVRVMEFEEECDGKPE